MARTLNFIVEESKETLDELLRFETDKRKLERLYFLFWYKSGLVKTRKEIAALLGRSLAAITRWIKRYLTGGLNELLKMDYQGRKSTQPLPEDAVDELRIELGKEKGFGSYQEIQAWIKEEHNVELAYSTVHRLVRYDLDASPKVVRPVAEKQNPEMVADFKDNLHKPLNEIVNPCMEKYGKVRYWVQDETRLSIKTWLRRRITRRGVKPRMKVNGQRTGYSLYGAVEIKTGEGFFREGNRMNREGFQGFLNEFSEKNPTDFHVLQLDNASFHTAKELVLPDNVMLLYQPPYSPEVNPIEQVWGWLKGKMAGEIFHSLDELKSRCREVLSGMNKQFLKSIVHRSFILDALDKAGI